MFSFIDWLALCWFVAIWFGYSRFSANQVTHHACISKVLNEFRHDWMTRILLRENRVSDMSAIANLERNAGFFASRCLFIVAGLFAVMAASDQALYLLSSFEFIQASSKEAWYSKFICLILIFIYCFFTFTWCMRQYGFCSVLVGAAPTPDEEIDAAAKRHFVMHAAEVMDLAGQHFNYGLRGFYFSLAVLAWFIGTLWFVLASVVVVWVLYRREFKSAALTSLIKARGL